MKRIIAAALAVIILLCTFCIFSAGAETQGIFYTSVTPVGDNSFLMMISVRDNPGIAALRLKLEYNDAAKLIEINDTGALLGFSAPSDLPTNSCPLMWLSSATSDLTGCAYIISLKFELNENKTIEDFDYSLSFGKNDVFNSQLESPDFVWEKGEPVMLDCDADGEVTSADALHILKTSVGILEDSPIVYALCDTDSDNSITSTDALYALKYSVGIIE